MKQIMARLNAGYWIVDCPKHPPPYGQGVFAEYYEGKALWAFEGEYICPTCYPKSASAYQVLENGRIVTKLDKSAYRTAKTMAQAADEVYQVVFPINKKEIEEAVSERPETMRNWDGWETIEYLMNENKVIKEIKGVG